MASVDGRQSLQDASDESFQFECNPCDYENIKAEAKHFCPECGDYLCDSCKLSHQKFSSTRKHQVVSGSLMPKNGETSKEPQFQNLALCSCYSKEVTLYCEDHNEVICVDCKILTHRSCKGVKIDVKCADIKSTTTESTHQNMNELKEKLETLQKRRNEDMQDLASQEDMSRETVKGFRREFNEKLKKMEEQSLTDIAKYAGEQRTTIQQHIDTCSAAINKLESDNCPYQPARTIAEKRLLFIHDLQLSKTMEHVKTVLEEINKEQKKPDISFEFDKSLKMTGPLRLGNVKPSQLTETGIVLSDMNIKSSRQVDVKIPADKGVARITGSFFMPTGELVLCDCGNKSIKLLKADLTLKESLTLPSAPWDVTVMSKDEVVITLPDIKSLMFINVYPTLHCGSTVQLDQVCRGVAVTDGLIYVSFDNGVIRVLDRNGQQQKNIYSTFRFNLPYFINITSSGMLCVSEHNSHAIRGLLNGSEVYKYTDPGLQYPLGVYIDGAENVLTCGYSSHNSHLIDKSGKKVKVLLSASDGLSSPYTLSFRQSDKTLVVGGNQMKLLVLEMA